MSCGKKVCIVSCIYVMSLCALAPQEVRKLRTEFESLMKQPNPDAVRAQAIINELRTAKETRIATELEKDLQTFFARTKEKEASGADVSIQENKRAYAEPDVHKQVAHELKERSLRIVDKLNHSSALLGKAQSAAQGNEEIKPILDELAQQLDGVRSLKDEIMHLVV